MSEKKELTVVWCDTETTGIETATSAAFELAFLVYRGGRMLEERVFYCNPLTETILFGEEAYKVNGVSEETIRSYPPAQEVMYEIAGFLDPYVQIPFDVERLVFAGYRADFDYGHVKALLERYGFVMDYYFNGRIIDVLELVKKAASKGLLPRTPNKKLETMTKALGIAHDGAHSALSDIKATRQLYETIWLLEQRRKHP